MDATDPYKDNSNFGRRHIITGCLSQWVNIVFSKLSRKDVSLGSGIQV